MTNELHRCLCQKHPPLRFVVLTGGPGGGKTSCIRAIQQGFCSHIQMLPESASVLYSGGFIRGKTAEGIHATQRAIYNVQHELETVVAVESNASLAICDRGTLDGAAYWPEGLVDFTRCNGTTPQIEFARYSLVIHLRTPTGENGYDLSNPVRDESPMKAQQVDKLLLDAWQGHPRRVIVDATENFQEKIERVVDILRAEAPLCCIAV